MDIKNDSFTSASGIMVKKDKLIKFALDSRKMNDNCKKNEKHKCETRKIIPYPERHQKITIGLDHTYAQVQLSKQAQKHCIFTIVGGGGDFTGHMIQNRNIWIPVISIIFQEDIERLLKNETLASLHDINTAPRCCCIDS